MGTVCRRRGRRVERLGLRCAVGWTVENLERRVLLSAVSWTGSGDGTNWTDPNNWSSHALPGQADDVTINVAAGTTINLPAQNSQSIRSLVSNATLEVGGNLIVSATAQLSGDLLLDGGLGGGVFNFNNGARIVIGSGFFTISVGGTINGDIDASTVDANFFASGLTLNGTLFLGNSSGTTFSRLAFSRADTLGGSGTIVFGSSGLNEIQNQVQAAAGTDGTLTIGPNITIRGKNGFIDDFDIAHFPGEQIVNRGTIDADGTGSAISVRSFITNQGTIEATGGGSLSLGNADNQSAATLLANGGTVTESGQLNDEGLAQALNGGTLNLHNLINAAGATVDAEASSVTFTGSISNQGTIRETNSTVTLAGDFSQADLGNFVRSGGTVNMTGTLHGDLTLNASTGPWNISGRLMDGTITTSDGTEPGIAAEGVLLIREVINGDLNLTLSANGSINVIDSLKVNGTLRLGNLAGTTSATVFLGTGFLNFGKGTPLGNDPSGIHVGPCKLTANQIIFGGGSGNGIVNQTVQPIAQPGPNDPPATSTFTENGLTEYYGGSGVEIDAPITGGKGGVTDAFSRCVITTLQPITASGAGGAIQLGGSGPLGVTLNSFSNASTISATNGAAISIGDLINTGTVNIDSGALRLFGTLRNQGTITATNSAVDLDGTFTQAGLGSFSRPGSIVDLSGTISGGLTLDANTGSWFLHGGTVAGGTVTETGGSLLGFTQFGGTLGAVFEEGPSPVTFNGDIDLADSISTSLQGGDPYAFVIGGLTLNGTLYMGNAFNTAFGDLYFGDQSHPPGTLSGNGTVVFGPSRIGAGIFNNWLGSGVQTLTVGPGITIRGRSGVVQVGNGGKANPIVLQGAVNADTAGGTIQLGDGFEPVTNQGTITATNGGAVSGANLTNDSGKTITLNGGMLTLSGSWTNNGIINSTNSTLNLGGAFTRANLGAFIRDGGSVNLTGRLSGGLLLDASTGSWVLSEGTIQGGRLDERDGSKLILSNLGGTLSGVTVNGDLDGTTINASQATILGGLVLNGTLSLGNAAGTISGGLDFGTFNSAAGTLAGNATIVFGGNTNFIDNDSALGGSAGTLTLAPSVTIHGQSGFLGNSAANGAIDNEGQINADISGGTINLAIVQGTFINHGVLQANGGTLRAGALVLSGQGLLRSDPPGSFIFSGSVSGDSTAVAASDLRGSATLNQSSSPTNPQLVEAMSADEGNTAAGFSHNFVYGKLTLASDNVKLVDQFDNASGAAPEALYANSLVVPSFATLDLNGLHVYARAAQLDGTILNGTVTVLPDGGPLTLNTLVPGAITPAGNVDDWTFFGRAGNLMTAFVDPGANSTPSAIAPNLVLAAAQLLGPDQQVLASGSSSGLGAAVTLANVALPVDGTYTVRVAAPADRPSLVGNYLVGAFDVTPRTAPLNLGQDTPGSIRTPFDVQKWTFSAPAGEQVHFHLLNETSAGLVYSLTGPNGESVFTNLAGDSALLDLPSTGTYTLEAQGRDGATGSYSFVVASTSVIDVPLNGSANGTFAGSGSAQLFKLSLPAVQSLLLELHDSSRVDTTEVYARFGEAPTREAYDFRSSSPDNPDQTLLVRDAAAGTWYVLVYGSNVPVAGPFNLSASASSGLHALSLTPAAEGNSVPEAVRVTGTGFEPGSTVTLTGPGGQQAASSVQIISDGELTATFPPGLPAGTYSLTVSHGGFSDTLANAFTITAGGSPHLQTDLTVPSALGRHEGGTLYVSYSNAGSVAMPAPLLVLSSDDPVIRPLMTLDASNAGRGFNTTFIPVGYSNTIGILASGAIPGILLPGESITVPVYWGGLQQPWDFTHPTIPLSLGVVDSTDTSPIDWNSLKGGLQPPGFSSLAWDHVFANLTTTLGNTEGQYIAALDAAASYLGSAGEHVVDLDRLFQFMLLQANDGLGPPDPAMTAVDDSLPLPADQALVFTRAYHLPLAGRDALGILGFGWSAPYQSALRINSDGSVALTLGFGGFSEVFVPDTRGGYFSPDPALSLARDADSYTLLNQDGSIASFTPDGKLAFEQDTHGNRRTLSYNGLGQLVGVVASSGQSLVFAYNAGGRLASVTDSDERVTSYAYDPSNQYLLSATGPQGTTSFTYDPASNALASITHRDGTHEFFTYDSQGRLVRAAHDQGIGAVSYAYTATGEVSTTDAVGDSLRIDFTTLGPARIIDGQGAATYFSYDANGNLLSTTDSLGRTFSNTYDAAGNLTGSSGPLLDTAHYTYGPLGRLTSSTDPNGHSTTFQYDLTGNLVSKTYPDTSQQVYSYDPLGQAISYINRRGQTTAFAYNSSGQLTQETFADQSHYDYGYDAHGNLVSATDSGGATTFTYDAADRITGVSYPNGKSLAFIYDAGGRRIQMTDQDGYAVRYGYTAAGQLERLTDSTGTRIALYTYDAAGRVVRQDNGNGTFTTYDYNAIGQVLHVINHAPGGAVNSRFDYTYNVLGEAIGVGTLDGNWSYTYDADGQLIHAVFGSINPAVPGEDLSYSYDPAGNRISTVENGVTTPYLTNTVNEYTRVGGIPRQYDADGNLLLDGTSTFTYDQLGNLTNITSADGTRHFTYNALGQRIASTANGQTTQYLIDPTGLGSVVSQYDSSGALLGHFNYGLSLVSQVNAAGASFFYDGGIGGSVVGLSDASGGYVNRYAYLPFGQIAASNETVANPFQFGGTVGEMSDGDNLVFMRARYYAPSRGVFLSGDPLQLGSGDTNFYRYVLNRPVQFSDPSGLGPQPVNLSDIVGHYGPGFPSTQGVGSPGAYPPAGGMPSNVNVNINVNITINASAPDPQPTKPPAGHSGDPNVTWYFKLLGTKTAAEQDDIAESEFAAFVVPSWINEVSYFETGEFFHPIRFVENAAENDASPRPNPQSLFDRFTRAVNSIDPNDKLGPAGFGAFNFVAAGHPLPYRIDFENDPAATAPAQEVVITDQLSPNLDWSTFRLSEIGWGDVLITVPSDSQHYQTTVRRTENGQTFDVHVEAGIDLSTGLVTARFDSIDPVTSLPPDVLTGFLPPENGTGRGQGHFTYFVAPKAGLPTGTAIRNIAAVSFDGAPIITTNQVNDEDPTRGTDPAKEALVTIDGGAPTSGVGPLPPRVFRASFPVSWAGQDDAGGSGVAFYDVYVSTDGGPFVLWLPKTAQTSGTYAGANGHTYSFYSVATDNVGNVQPTPASGQATTKVVIVTGDVNADGSVSFSDLLTLAQHYGKLGVLADGDINGDGTVNFADLLLLAQNYGRAAAPTVAAAQVWNAAGSPDGFTWDLDSHGRPVKVRRPPGHST